MTDPDPDPDRGAGTTTRLASADIADWLRERIRQGRLVPGQRLVEIDVARATGGSRNKVREAFQRLEAERVVVIEEFRGASVRTASAAEIREIYRIRVALEGLCAHDFALHGTAKDRERLAALQRLLDQSVAERTPERFAKLNADWHRQVVAGARNRLIANTVNALTVPINRMIFERFYDEKWLRSANDDHRIVTQAVLAGDGKAAEARMRQHIEDGLDAISSISDAFHLSDRL